MMDALYGFCAIFTRSPTRRPVAEAPAHARVLWVRISALSVVVRHSLKAAPKSSPIKDHNDPHAMPRLRCRAPSALTAKQCSRCKTRYCGPACQKTHWEAGGHDKLCKKIRKGGGAEQYHANTKYTEAVTLSRRRRAPRTRRARRATSARRRSTGRRRRASCAGVRAAGRRGLRMCRVLAEQAKILVAEAEENNLDDSQWHRWYKCSLCEQHYHGVVSCALGWACWKTAYLGRPETDWARGRAMTHLGAGLSDAGHHEDALSVREAKLATAAAPWRIRK